MEYFRSVFIDEPDPPPSTSSIPQASSTSSSSSSPVKKPAAPDPADQNAERTGGGGSDAASASAWSFGVLMKTFAARSESVIETYRRDLKEFGSGLKKETETLREVASRAVKDLPVSIDIGASRAHGSLESMTQAIDSMGSTVWKSTAEIIAQGKETLLHPDLDSDWSDDCNSSSSSRAINSARYSRCDVQLRAIQVDVNSYVEEPEDLDDYIKWKSGFELGNKTEEVESLMRENTSVKGIYKGVVPSVVDHVAFWSRYYYRVHRLKQAEFLRENLVKKAIGRDDDDELSWDVDDDDDDEKKEAALWEVGRAKTEDTNGSAAVGAKANPTPAADSSKKEEVIDGKGSLPEVQDMTISARAVVDENKHAADQSVGYTIGLDGENTLVLDEKLPLEVESSMESVDRVAIVEKYEPSGCGKDSGMCVISNQPSPDEEELSWDEIEDIGSGDEKKVFRSPDRAVLRKCLSTADEVEDLSWDIEEDDEPIKA
ncbi:hypothetical protein Dimus_037347 [Dionaea muscipula]